LALERDLADVIRFIVYVKNKGDHFVNWQKVSKNLIYPSTHVLEHRDKCFQFFGWLHGSLSFIQVY